MAVYGYTRVSTQLQSDDGLSLDTQERQLQGYAMMNDMTLDQVFVERAVSGWKPLFDRAEGERLSAVLKQGDTILCPKLDRMFRSARDALVVSDELKKRGVKLHLLDLGGDVTGNGVSKVFFTIVAAFAEFESKGRFLGGSRPFGYTISDDGSLVPDSKEQEIIVEACRLRSQGKSLRAISGAISGDEIKISHMSVKRILKDNLV
jgi:putative DNA-invertase from lambdoid prophage Rac